MKRRRRNHSPAFKAKVALEVLKGEKTIAPPRRPPDNASPVPGQSASPSNGGTRG